MKFAVKFTPSEDMNSAKFQKDSCRCLPRSQAGATVERVNKESLRLSLCSVGNWSENYRMREVQDSCQIANYNFRRCL